VCIFAVHLCEILGKSHIRRFCHNLHLFRSNCVLFVPRQEDSSVAFAGGIKKDNRQYKHVYTVHVHCTMYTLFIENALKMDRTSPSIQLDRKGGSMYLQVLGNETTSRDYCCPSLFSFNLFPLIFFPY
jgi:hypothetical protein